MQLLVSGITTSITTGITTDITAGITTGIATGIRTVSFGPRDAKCYVVHHMITLLKFK